MKVYGTSSPRFLKWQGTKGLKNNNGAYWYAKEIEDIILPNIKFENILILTAGATLYSKDDILDYSVVVCHDNRNTTKSYTKLFQKNILWICSKHSTAKKLKAVGEKSVYIPLSIDTEYVKKFKAKKTKEIAFVGNSWSFKKDYLAALPGDIKQLSNMSRDELLKEMAKYKRVIAEGRCLMEAQVLGAKCEVPDYGEGIESVFVKPVDSRDTIEKWQKVLEAHSKTIGDKCILQVTRPFKDLAAKKQRAKGDMYYEENKRAEELLNNKNNIVIKL